MFKIVENEDGSTTVYSSDSGKLICSVRGNKRPTLGIGHPIPRADRAIDSPSNDVIAAPRTGHQLLSPFDFKSSPDSKFVRSPFTRSLAYNEDNIPDNASVISDFSTSSVEDFSDECIDQDGFLHCLGLCATSKFECTSLQQLKSNFPLRKIARSDPESVIYQGKSRAKLLDDTDLCSPLGRKTLNSCQFYLLNNQAATLCVKKYEKYCQFSLVSLYVYGSHIPHLRCRELLKKYPLTFRPLKSWGHNKAHLYSFTKRQRVERFKTLESGLDRKGRELKSICRKMTVRLKRLSKADISKWIKKEGTNKSIKFQFSKKKNELLKITKSPITENGHNRFSLNKNISGVRNKLSELPAQTQVYKTVNNHIAEVSETNQSYGAGANKLSELLSKTPISVANSCLLAELMKSQTSEDKSSLSENSSKCFLFEGKNNRALPTILPVSRKATDISIVNHENTIIMRNCSVKLQDVTKNICKINDKYFVSGTNIKVFSADANDKRKRMINNVIPLHNYAHVKSMYKDADCISLNPNLSHDHAYHRMLPNSSEVTISPILNSHKAAKTEMNNSLRNSSRKRYSNIRVSNSVCCTENEIPNDNRKGISLQKNHSCTRQQLLKPELPVMNFETKKIPFLPVSPVVVKPIASSNVNQQLTKSIVLPFISKTQTAKSEYFEKNKHIKTLKSNIPTQIARLNTLTASSSQTLIVTQWIFQCFGCGYKSSFSTKTEADNKIVQHMTGYHSVLQPESFLSSYIESAKKTIVIEAFPGYKTSMVTF